MTGKMQNQNVQYFSPPFSSHVFSGNFHTRELNQQHLLVGQTVYHVENDACDVIRRHDDDVTDGQLAHVQQRVTDDVTSRR